MSLQNSLLSSLHAACDQALKEIIQTLQPKIIIGIGRYAEEKALKVVQPLDQKIDVIYMPHPSPRVPNNKDWEEKAEKVITENNLLTFLNEPKWNH